MKRLFGCAMVMLALLVVLAIVLACGNGIYSPSPSPPTPSPTPEPTPEPRHTGAPPPEETATATAVPSTPLPSPATEETPTDTPVPTPTTEPPTPSPEPSPTGEAPTPTPPASQEPPDLTVAVQSPSGEALNSVVDGNGLLLVARLDNPTDAPVEGAVQFVLDDTAVEPMATCQLQAAPGSSGACTAVASADGWAWQNRQRVQKRSLLATLEQHQLAASISVSVQPKPVVLVHGTNSGAWAWQAWTGADGFLAAQGLRGFAVGDGQFGIEPMNIGDFNQPRQPTNTIAENAAILARYVEAVRQATGAERVDVVSHSAGGLVSRHYVATLMPVVERAGLPSVPAVNQLYMLGTPNAGTTCAILPAILGLYAPASAQMTPSYTQNIFNHDINDSRGVPFLVLAGDPIRDYTALVCTTVPTDVYVSVASAAASIPVIATQMPVLHGEQITSPEAFDAVFRSLARSPDEYPIPLPTAPAPSQRTPVESTGNSLQIAALESGTLDPEKPTTLRLDVDKAEAMSVVLYTPGQDVGMTLTTSRDREIAPETVASQPDVTLRKEDDPSTPVSKGFRIANPETGAWEVQLTSTAKLPKAGSLWAVAVFVESDLRLTGEARPAAVQPGEAVVLRAVLTGPGDAASTQVKAVIRDTGGQVVAETPLFDNGAHQDDKAGDGVFAAAWKAPAPGVYTATLTAVGQRSDGVPFQRVAVVAVQVK